MTNQREYLPKATLKLLARRSNLRGAWLVAHCWGVIVAMVALVVLLPHPLTYLLAVIVIGSRQLGLAILMHDAAHGILFKSRRANEFIGTYCLAYPIGTDLKGYRKYHLKHHALTQTAEDPDLGLSAPFPVSRGSLFRKALRDLSGLTGLKLRAQQILMLTKSDKTRAFSNVSVFGFLGAQAVLLAIFTALGIWPLFFALWALPLLTWFQWVLRVRNIAEHALTSHDDNPLTHARTTQAGWLERAIIAPYYVNYHVEHHAFMYVPCFNLRAAHRQLIQNFGTQMTRSNSYADVLAAASTG
ncbi:fatty acid desaturase family protein [Robiginitomaculum antarcticum]|uniref:fatty acid desaturase family protein n=1 Tax=Robiginitomaculum antarcticum TaxID=437507 RepID=UPI0003A6F3BA|nr:fatty acid desaturase family protein [Robiginitomaculum antarcticum]